MKRTRDLDVSYPMRGVRSPGYSQRLLCKQELLWTALDNVQAVYMVFVLFIHRSLSLQIIGGQYTHLLTEQGAIILTWIYLFWSFIY